MAHLGLCLKSLKIQIAITNLHQRLASGQSARSIKFGNVCQRARAQCQSAAVTTSVILSCSFLSCVSKHLLNATGSIVVSAVGAYRLVDNMRPRLSLTSLKIVR